MAEAESWFQKAVDWDKQSPRFYQKFCVIPKCYQQKKEAIIRLKEAYKLDEYNPSIPFMIALIYAELGNKNKTAASNAIKIKPSYQLSSFCFQFRPNSN